MKKKILLVMLLIATFGGITSVNAGVAYECQYSPKTASGNGIVGTVSIKVNDDSTTDFNKNSFDSIHAKSEAPDGNVYYFASVPSSVIDEFNRYVKDNYGKCPRISVELINTQYNFRPNDYADSTGYLDPTVKNTGKTVVPSKEEVKCDIIRDLRNKQNALEQAHFKFYVKDGVEYWSVTVNGQTDYAKAGEVLTNKGRLYNIDAAKKNDIFKNGNCGQVFLSCMTPENITVTGTKPNDVENCAVKVTEAGNDEGTGDTPIVDDDGNKITYTTRKKEKGHVQELEGNVGDNFCSEAEVQSALRSVGYVLFAAKILVPLIIIVIGTIDMFKTSYESGDPQGALKKHAKSLIIRVVMGILIFFLPTIVYAILNVADELNVVASETLPCRKALLDPWDYGLSVGPDTNNSAINTDTDPRFATTTTKPGINTETDPRYKTN